MLCEDLHYPVDACHVPCGYQKWVENGSFNTEHMTEADYSHSTAILLMLYLDALLNDIESVGIGLIVCQCRALLGQVSSITWLIKYVCSLLEFKRQSFTPICRTYCCDHG